MQIRYPKSFFKLMFVGFLLAVLPLAAGLLADTVAIERLVGQSRQAVYDAARIAQGSRQLADSVTALERAALQGLLLRDEDLWQGYQTRHEEFAARIERLRTLPLDADTGRLLDTLAGEEAGIHARLEERNGRDGVKPAELSDRFAELFRLSRKLLAHANASIEHEAEALRTMALETESRAWLQLAIALPLALTLVAGFTRLLARPISQLEAGIRGLGERRFEHRIEVGGPEDLQQLGRRLEWLRLRLSQLEEQKSRFLRHVSHELKTPLTALREGSDLLAEGVGGPLAPRQREIVDILRDNSLHLQRLIEGMLRHGEAEFREAGLKIQPVRPARVMAEVAAKQRIALDARKLALRSSGGEFTMLTDPDRLRVVLDNLLSNAIKYSPAGGVIEFTAEESGGVVRLRVLDEGPGIAPADKPNVFDAFYRGSAPAMGTVKGSGLGLSICRDHVESLGGTIEVGDGRGDFTVTLPKGEA
jgi:two-component system, NtrC family, sensor histidine kinase GlrK